MKLLELYQFFENKDARQNLRPTTIDISKPKSKGPDEDASVLLVINKIESSPEIIKALREIDSFTGKYKLLLHFAQVLGISQDEFHNTIANMQIYQKQTEE